MCSLPSKFDSVLKAFDEQFPCLRTKYNSNLSALCVQTYKLLNSKLKKKNLTEKWMVKQTAKYITETGRLPLLAQLNIKLAI